MIMCHYYILMHKGTWDMWSCCSLQKHDFSKIIFFPAEKAVNLQLWHLSASPLLDVCCIGCIYYNSLGLWRIYSFLFLYVGLQCIMFLQYFYSIFIILV